MYVVNNNNNNNPVVEESSAETSSMQSDDGNPSKETQTFVDLSTSTQTNPFRLHIDYGTNSIVILHSYKHECNMRQIRRE